MQKTVSTRELPDRRIEHHRHLHGSATEIVVPRVDAERRDEAAPIEAVAEERRGRPRSGTPHVAIGVEMRELTVTDNDFGAASNQDPSSTVTAT